MNNSLNFATDFFLSTIRKTKFLSDNSFISRVAVSLELLREHDYKGLNVVQKLSSSTLPSNEILSCIFKSILASLTFRLSSKSSS